MRREATNSDRTTEKEAKKERKMAKKRVVRHRILEVATTLLVIVIITTLRAALLPAGDEVAANTETPIGIYLQSLQGSIPTLAIFIWAFSLLFGGLDAGRFSSGYSIYPAYTLMAIPVFGIIAGGVMVSSEYVLSAVVMAVMLLATKYLLRCIMRTDSFSDLSLAMIYYGVLPLMFAPSALLYLTLPLMILVARSSWRDWVVAVTSLIFPLLSVCYWSWCAGEGFLSPAEMIYTSALTSSEFSFYSTINPAGIVILGVAIVMVLCAVILILSEKYSLKVKSRAAMRFIALLLIVCVGMFFLPSATATTFVIVAVPAAILTPLIFVRMGIGFTETLYRLMLLAVAANMAILCWM